MKFVEYTITLLTIVEAVKWSYGKEMFSLKILPDQPQINHPAGQTIAFSCRGYPENPTFFTNFRWYDFTGKLIERPSDLDDNDSTLVIHNPETTDSGMYRCTAVFQNTHLLSASIYLNVYKEITWDDCLAEQDLVHGRKGQKILCRLSGTPGPEVSYKKDRRPIGHNDRLYAISNDGLEIKNAVSDMDSGDYLVTAVVRDTGVLEERLIKVRVIKPPKIELFEINGTEYGLGSSAFINEDNRIIIGCRSGGYPSPMYSFMDANKHNLSDVPGFIVDPARGELTIERVRIEDNYMPLTCTALNAAGEDVQSLNLKINTKPKILSFNNVSYNVGELITWECRVSGNPQPNIFIRKWSDKVVATAATIEQVVRDSNKVDVNLLPETMYETVSVENSYTVYRMNKRVDRSDDGLYVCAATNLAGTGFAIGHLEIRFPPDLSKTQTNVMVWGDDLINLTCIAESIPNATIIWSFNAKPVNEKDFVIYPGYGVSSVMIRPIPKYYGYYNCTAINQLGEASVLIRLNEATEPSPPDIKELFAYPTFLELRFQPQLIGDQLPVKTIHFKYWTLAEDESSARYISRPLAPGTKVHDTIYRIDGLIPQAKYYMRMAGENEVGIGDYSSIRLFETPAEKRPEAPNILMDDENRKHLRQYGYLLFKDTDTVSIRWSPANDNGREIQSYELKYYEIHREGNEWIDDGQRQIKQISAVNQLVYYFTALELNVFYKVELRSENKIGKSSPTSIIIIQSDGKSPVGGHRSESMARAVRLVLYTGPIIVLYIIIDLIFYIRCHFGILYLIFKICGCTRHKKECTHLQNLDVFSPQKLIDSSPRHNL